MPKYPNHYMQQLSTILRISRANESCSVFRIQCPNLSISFTKARRESRHSCPDFERLFLFVQFDFNDQQGRFASVSGCYDLWLYRLVVYLLHIFKNLFVLLPLFRMRWSQPLLHFSNPFRHHRKQESFRQISDDECHHSQSQQEQFIV